jgi:hypothetical protein
LPGSDHLDLIPGEFWVVVAMVWWTSRSFVGNQLLPSVVFQFCNFDLLISILPREIAFGQGENPA